VCVDCVLASPRIAQDDPSRRTPPRGGSVTHALGTVRGVETDPRLQPPVVRHRPRSTSGCCHLLTQGLDDAPRCNVLRAPKHDVECFAMLVIIGLGVRVAVDGFQCSLGVLELHLLIFLLLGAHLLFALPLAERCAFLARLLLLFAELFHELLDLPTLTHVVARVELCTRHRAPTSSHLDV
jgi:hypothetical protein